MKPLFLFAAHNVGVTLVFAFVVFGLMRIWRNPPIAHALWLLVLLRLVAPPLLPIACFTPQTPGSMQAPGPVIADESRTEAQQIQHHVPSVGPPTTEMPAAASTTSAPEYGFTVTPRLFWDYAQPALFWCWIGGAGVYLVVVVTRILRFERLLRDTPPASEELQRLALRVAARLGVRRVPDVRQVECVKVPFVWCAGRRPTIVLPAPLLGEFGDEQLALILAHELAHLRRRDHWVRVAELIVSIVYWWNPLVRLIRRQLHEAEELCCDAWVRWAFPDSTKRYAELLFALAEGLNGPQVAVGLRPASPMLRSLSLKARIEMILESRFTPWVSTRATILVKLLAILLLSMFVQVAKLKAREGPNDEAPVAPARESAPPSSELLNAVRFEQGATRFLKGDDITILEVRGTADKFAPGNTYWIKGTYKLVSHERAMLGAYITAMDAENGQSASLKVQTRVVDRGNGTFTLFLPMPYRGWPHVSFYPANGGEGFGGNYFGTADTVLKRWWGSKETDVPATSATAASPAEATTPLDSSLLAKRFKYRVPFEIGRTQTKDGGRIEIREVWGTRPQIEIGGQYVVRGRYALPPNVRGKVFLSATAGGPWGQTASLDLQSIAVDAQEGEFTLVHGMAGPGWFHVILTDAERSSRWFADVYFGTGDNVHR